MKGFITFIITFLGLSVAQAYPPAFMGVWEGEGTYILNSDITNCSYFNLNFSANMNSFTFVDGVRECEKHSEQFYPVTVQYRDGKLYFGSQVVGSYSENYMEMRFSAPEENGIRHWRMSMRLEGDHLVYEESRTMNDETTPMISFAGVLIRQ
tara:strand:+ start:20340 stop:20795 length:456 start_codon:yes stop_codon:yes gene_type:complete